jgi:4-hydroxybenzoate polyprenyltransferase
LKKPVHFSFPAVFKLIRLGNLVMIGGAQYLVRIFLIGPKENWLEILIDPHLITLALSTVLIAAAGYIINDYYDVKIDTINKPDRVVLGQVIKRRVALWGHILLNAAALSMAAALSKLIFALHFLSGFLLWLYSNKLKRLVLWGNLSIALLTSLAMLEVQLFFGGSFKLVFVFALFAFFISLIREVVKDIEDRKGDKAFGCKTIPIVWGIRKTKRFLFWLTVAYMLAVVPLVYWSGLTHLWLYFIFILCLLLGFLTMLWRADTTKHFSRLSWYCKWIMLVGLFGMFLI